MNIHKNILIICFDKFFLHKQNVSKIIATRIYEKILENPKYFSNNNTLLILDIKNYKKQLNLELAKNNYDYILGMGLYICHGKCRWERLQQLTSNNFINSDQFKYRYGHYGKEKSPCFWVRDFLEYYSPKKGGKWEFIHIPQKFLNSECKIKEISQILYEEIEQAL